MYWLPSINQFICNPGSAGLLVEDWFSVHIDIARDQDIGPSPDHHIPAPHSPIMLLTEATRRTKKYRNLQIHLKLQIFSIDKYQI